MSCTIVGIDPGPRQSAYVVVRTAGRLVPGLEHYAPPVIVAHGKVGNEGLFQALAGLSPAPGMLAIEMIASYGMPVGAEVFETCVWIGRFMELWNRYRGHEHPIDLVYRKDVKMHLCGSTRAKDPNIRQALIDLYGGVRATKRVKIGKQSWSEGPLYGIAGDEWAALGVALTFAQTKLSRMCLC